MVATVIFGCCLAVYWQPSELATPAVFEADIPVEPPTFSETAKGFFGWWPIQLSALSLGISTVMHVLVSIAGLREWLRWMIAISVPVCGMVAWDLFDVYFLGNDPVYIGVSELFPIYLIIFSAGFATVTALFTVINREQTETEHRG